jgi:chemotaxis protein histidine kinase CheA
MTKPKNKIKDLPFVPDPPKVKKAEPKKAEPKKAEPKKAEPKKAEPKKVEPKKAEPKKAEPNKATLPAKTIERAKREAASFAVRTELLDNWMELNKVISTMQEPEAFALIEAERAGRCRPNIILRLHGRFNRLRAMREKREMMIAL